MAKYCRYCGKPGGLRHLLSFCNGLPGLGGGPRFCEDCGTKIAHVGVYHYDECPNCCPEPWNRREMEKQEARE